MRHLRPVSEITLDRARRDPKFRAELLAQAVECIVEDDVATAKKLIRDYVLSSIGFEALGKRVDKRPESLMRMLSDKGNPNLNNLATLLASLKKHAGVRLRVQASR